MTCRVRFAPSPTGHLHIGGARTALYNWLLARKLGGKFILRVEDTDTERSTQEYVDSIMDGMRWLGLLWDEGPYHQMERMDIYRAHVDQLMREGNAYRCYCTVEELTAKREAAQKAGQKPKYDGTCRDLNLQDDSRPYVIRFKAPTKGTTVVHDAIRGDIPFENKELDDLIIMRGNNTPTYNFTVVVDDVTMKITHVIRGDDHLNNTPRQILMYNAFNYPVPTFAHLPMILGSDKKKLSKRHAATSVVAYRDLGYLPEALLNYLARLGWSHGDQEIFSLMDMIEAFDLEHVGKSAAIFDPDKLNWVNQQHIKKLGDAELTHMCVPFFQKEGVAWDNQEFAIAAVRSERERAKTLADIAKQCRFYFVDQVEYDPASVEKWLTADGKALLQKIHDRMTQVEPFTAEAIGAAFKELVTESGLKMVSLAQPCRVALCGCTVSPGVYEVMAILGKEKTLKRLTAAINKS
ncbi:MAG: glutamate--tRNA ligase [Deltaproteobacteria bacterium CG11_big_fil_rev_8_21_14_0_20_47_16]|nr:MAG: glutamate--tRNA ligase [Deltaproteobacteria bacterium CG11_big_fil_rev_8_21_14_0_20_47_16]